MQDTYLVLVFKTGTVILPAYCSHWTIPLAYIPMLVKAEWRTIVHNGGNDEIRAYTAMTQAYSECVSFTEQEAFDKYIQQTIRKGMKK